MEQARGLKVVLFCGGQGLRLREYSRDDPEADGPRSATGRSCGTSCATTPTSATRDFILCLGYRADVDQGVLPPLQRGRSPTTSSCPTAARRSSCSARTSRTGGSRSPTPGSRRRSASGCGASGSYLDGEEIFLANYGDTLTDAPLDELIEQFRASRQGRRVPGGPPRRYTFHVVELDDGQVVDGIELDPRVATSGSTAATSSSGARSSTTCSRARSWSRSRSPG